MNARMLGCGLFLLTCVALLISCTGQPENQRRVQSIRTVEGQILIQLYLPEGFPILNRATPLVIGDKEFGLTRSTGDMERKTLIYVLTPAEFAQLPDGAPVSVSTVANFGLLDKSMLDRQ